MGFSFSKFLRIFNVPSSSKQIDIKKFQQFVLADLLNSPCDANDIQLKDRISELPDDIMASIVSKLSLKEIARCSILSHKWRYLWKLSNHLDFEYDARKVSFEDEYADSHSFVEWVNRVLEAHDTTKVEHVRISYGLNNRFKSDLDNWLKIVFSKQIQSLDLHLQWRHGTFKGIDRYTLNHDIFCESETTCNADPQFIGFKSLKSLRLYEVNVSEEDIEFLLNNCRALERLHINCTSLINFKLTGKHHALRFLELNGRFKNIEISDVNLVSFSCLLYRGANLVLKNVPSLSCLYLKDSIVEDFLTSKMNDTIAQLSSSLKSLTLRLPLNMFQGYPNLTLLPKLTALEELVVQKGFYNGCMFPYFKLIEMCPNLQNIEFQATWSENIPLSIGGYEYGRKLDPPHQCLKEVKLGGYYGCNNDVKSVLYFFDNAVALEKVYIDPRNQDWIRYGLPQKDHETKREQAARGRAKKQLKGKAPPRVQLTII